MKDLLERIVCDPLICSGKPCIKGTRIPVHMILDLFAAGEDHDGIKRAYPQLTEKDIRACHMYASVLKNCKKFPPGLLSDTSQMAPQQ